MDGRKLKEREERERKEMPIPRAKTLGVALVTNNVVIITSNTHKTNRNNKIVVCSKQVRDVAYYIIWTRK